MLGLECQDVLVYRGKRRQTQAVGDLFIARAVPIFLEGASGLITRFRSSPKAFRVIPFAGFFAAGSGASGGRDVMPPPYHAQLFENAM
jgi:hypothetical protein